MSEISGRRRLAPEMRKAAPARTAHQSQTSKGNETDSASQTAAQDDFVADGLRSVSASLRAIVRAVDGIGKRLVAGEISRGVALVLCERVAPGMFPAALLRELDIEAFKVAILASWEGGAK